MRWSFPVARLGGIELRVHATFLLLLAWVGVADGMESGWTGAWQGVAFVLLVFGCVILHELGHAFAARRYGIRTPDITLMPMGGVARLERIPEKPSEELVVALAGPLVSGALALGAWILSGGGLGGGARVEWEWELGGKGGVLGALFAINLGLLVFNLLPAFPMDGGRVLRAALAWRLGLLRATRWAAGIGQVLAVGLAGLALVAHAPVLLLVAVFVFFGAASEAAQTELRLAARGLRVRDAMITAFETLPRSALLGQAADLLQHTSQHDFPVVDGSGRFWGMLTRARLILGLQRVGPGSQIADFVEEGLPSVQPGHLFAQAFAFMQQHESPVLPVVDEGGRLVGLFSQEKVGELLLLHSVMHPEYRPVAWGLAPRGGVSLG
jgi:Zn-dependent protease/CBS domain-containing protein